jgi:hypothetical protein
VWDLEGKGERKDDQTTFLSDLEYAFLFTSPLTCRSQHNCSQGGMSWHGAGTLTSQEETRQLAPDSIFFNLGHRAEGDDVSANICSLVQNIFPSYIVLANIVNLWVDFRPK